MEAHEQFLTSAAEVIQGLGLTDLASEEVAVRRQGWETKDGQLKFYRGITVFPVEEREAAGTNEREDIGYGVGIVMCVGNDHSPEANVGLLATWRTKVRRKFIHQRLPNITVDGANQLNCTVEPGDFPTPKDHHRYDASFLILRCWMRESRE